LPGGALVVSGIIVSALGTGSLIGSFLKSSTVIAQTLIKPSDSVNVTLRVTDVGRIISITIHTNSEMSNATLNELVRDSYGTVMSNHNFQSEILSTFKPPTIGEYVLTISNNGPSSVIVNDVFGYIPIIGENNEVKISPVGGIITGVILAIIGIIALIVGIVIVILDRKGNKPKSSVKK
jgi:hypothetical protein